MVIVSCHFCGVEFESKTVRSRFCSANCRDLTNRGVDCAGCGKRVHRASTSADVQFCLQCRRAGSAPVNHGYSGYKRGCRCDVCRAAQAKSMREYASKRKSAGKPIHKTKATVARVCELCGDSFDARVDGLKRGRGRFCSARCGNTFRSRARGVSARTRAKRARARERQREFGKQGSVRWRALRRAKGALELNGGNRVFVTGSCAVCGAGFTGIGQFARYCSDECAKRNAPDAFGIRWLDRMYLYDRDEWKCHLCGLEVVYGVDDYDPRMATLDHLVPQSLGGGHEFENLATAHLLCNSIRRELPVEEFRSGEAVAMLRQRLADSMEVAA